MLRGLTCGGVERNGVVSESKEMREGLLLSRDKATVERKILHKQEPDVCWIPENAFFYFTFSQYQIFLFFMKSACKLGVENCQVWFLYCCVHKMVMSGFCFCVFTKLSGLVLYWCVHKMVRSGFFYLCVHKMVRSGFCICVFTKWSGLVFVSVCSQNGQVWFLYLCVHKMVRSGFCICVFTKWSGLVFVFVCSQNGQVWFLNWCVHKMVRSGFCIGVFTK